jgi:hypothetical protein
MTTARATGSPRLRKAKTAAAETMAPIHTLCTNSLCPSQRNGQNVNWGKGSPSGCGQRKPTISAG